MREDAAVNSEIVLDLGHDKTIGAIMTKESAQTLNLRRGNRASALIKAGQIIVAMN